MSKLQGMNSLARVFTVFIYCTCSWARGSWTGPPPHSVWFVSWNHENINQSL